MCKAFLSWKIMPDVSIKPLVLFVCFLILFSLVRLGYSMAPVAIEFFYYEPCSCNERKYEIYLHNNQVVESIERDYGSKVLVEKIPFYSQEGQEKIEEYGIGIRDWNAIVINYGRVILGYANETYVKEIVDAYLYGSVHDIAIIRVALSNSTVDIGERINIVVTLKNLGTETESFKVNVYCNESLIGTRLVRDLSPNHELSIIFVWDTTNQTSGDYVVKAEAEPVVGETYVENNVGVYSNIEVTTSSGLMAMFMLAFLFGFFETFSPCLIILLSFVLSYTIGKVSGFKEGFSKVMAFGAGFMSATLLLAVVFGLVFLSMPAFQYSFTWIVCVFALLLGLNLLGILKIPSKITFQSKPLIKKLSKKYVITYAGLFLLGFIFYFLDPCIAPIFVSMMPLLTPENFLFSLFVFCLGAFIPFVGIGILAGSVSKLARFSYRHRFKIRAVSGLILISYALYLIVLHLLPKLVI